MEVLSVEYRCLQKFVTSNASSSTLLKHVDTLCHIQSLVILHSYINWVPYSTSCDVLDQSFFVPYYSTTLLSFLLAIVNDNGLALTRYLVKKNMNVSIKNPISDWNVDLVNCILYDKFDAFYYLIEGCNQRLGGPHRINGRSFWSILIERQVTLIHYNSLWSFIESNHFARYFLKQAYKYNHNDVIFYQQHCLNTVAEDMAMILSE